MTWGSKDWSYYDKPVYNPLVGKVVIAYRERVENQKERLLKLEYLCQGEVDFVEITGELVFDKGEEESGQ